MKKHFEEAEIEVIQLGQQDVICTSGTDIDVSNPFEGSREENW